MLRSAIKGTPHAIRLAFQLAIQFDFEYCRDNNSAQQLTSIRKDLGLEIIGTLCKYEHAKSN